MKYPKTLYVQRENAGTEDEYILACEKFEELERDGELAVYELKRMVKRETKISID